MLLLIHAFTFYHQKKKYLKSNTRLFIKVPLHLFSINKGQREMKNIIYFKPFLCSRNASHTRSKSPLEGAFF